MKLVKKIARTLSFPAGAILVAAFGLLLVGCGGGSAKPVNPTPIITGLFPSSTTAGGPAFTLSVDGLELLSTSTVNWNGNPRTTTFNTGTGQLQASISAADIANPGIAQVTITNPPPGGGTSFALTFTINPPSNPVPSITSLSPSSAVAGGAAFTLTVNGTNFVSVSGVNWNGSPRTTTFVSATELTAQINSSDIASPGTARVTVTNPAPGGGTSNAATFTITATSAGRFPVVVSVNARGGPADGASGAPKMDASGRFVAFVSAAGNLVAGAHGTVYVRDSCLRAANCEPRTFAVDLAEGGGAPDAASRGGMAISANGRYVAFASSASNLVAGGSNGQQSVFLRDTCLGLSSSEACAPKTIRVSGTAAGAEANGDSDSPAVSADGRFLVFRSAATNLAPGGNGFPEIYVRDTCLGATAPRDCHPSTLLVSANPRDDPANGAASAPAVSFSGRYVVFQSAAGDIVPGVGSGISQIYLRDTCLGPDALAGCSPRTMLISAGVDGRPGNALSADAAISQDGRWVVFVSGASNLLPGVASGFEQIFARDTCLGSGLAGCKPATMLVSADVNGNPGGGGSVLPVISPDGRLASFVSSAKDLVAYDASSSPGIFVRELCRGTPGNCVSRTARLASLGSNTMRSRAAWPIPFSRDGRYVSFFSRSRWLAPGLSSGVGDVFLAPVPF